MRLAALLVAHFGRYRPARHSSADDDRPTLTGRRFRGIGGHMANPRQPLTAIEYLGILGVLLGVGMTAWVAINLLAE